MPLDYSTRYLLAYAAALLFGVTWSLRHRWNQAFGLAVMSVPLWQVLLSILNNWASLSDRTTTLTAISPWGLSRWFSGGIIEDFGYLTLGFVAWQAHRNGWFPSPRILAAELANLGRDFRRNEAHSVRTGLLLFPALIIATAFASWFVSNSSLQSGDESQIFRYMTPYHAIFLSLAAGFGEELFYRGFLFIGLRRICKFRGGFWVALILQAVMFGLAHSGYGTWSHVLLPTLFGLIAGLVSYRYGIWAAITMHVFVDIVAFGAEASAHAPWFWNLIAWALIVNILVSVGFVLRASWHRLRPHAA